MDTEYLGVSCTYNNGFFFQPNDAVPPRDLYLKKKIRGRPKQPIAQKHKGTLKDREKSTHFFCSIENTCH